MPVVVRRRRIGAALLGLAVGVVPPSIALTAASSASGAPASGTPRVVTAPAPAALAATTPLTVSQAVSTQDGRSATVRGYVVGQPTATSTVVGAGGPHHHPPAGA